MDTKVIKEEAYWSERKFLRDLIDQLPAAIFWKNTASIFLGCNHFFANLAGLSSPQEIIGKTDYDLPWGESQGDDYRKDDQLILQSKQPKLGIEELQTLADGREIVLLTSKIPLFAKNNDIVGILGIYIDITERKKIERSLEEAKNRAEVANSAKTEFIANMSHDIRTPLSGIIGMSKLIEDSSKDNQEKQYAQWVNESGEQLLDLLNGVLDVVSADNIKETDVHNEAFNLRSSIRDIVQLELPTVKLKKLDLLTDIDESIPDFIVSDKLKLNRIILNILGNAIKFTEKGNITIRLKKMAQDENTIHVEFSVIDTGIGIPEQLQSKVFDRFYRVNPSYKGGQRGHGVGLHIAQRYVELLGGELKLSSKVGEGTTFFFTLALTVDPSKDITTQAKSFDQAKDLVAVESENSLKKLPHILIVEDNLIALRIAETLTKQVGCNFSTATDGEQALKLIKATDFDLIITDVGLPNISGNELTRYIRAWEKTSNKKPIPIVGLTAQALGEAERECLKAGMNKVLVKPIYLHTMQAIIKQYITADDLAEKHQGGKLGRDLPDNEEQLFELDKFNLLDIEVGTANLGNVTVLNELLELMISQAIPEDLAFIQKAHAEKNWEQVENIAHKMKSGALYCGTTKMQYACQYLERYRKAGYFTLLEPLYQQLIQVVAETKNHLERWLADQKK